MAKEARAQVEADEAIRSFLEESEAMGSTPCNAESDDLESELFWNQLDSGNQMAGKVKLNSVGETSEFRGPGWDHSTRTSRRAMLASTLNTSTL